MKQKTLQEQYNLISEGKGNKESFVRAAKRQFPNMVRNAASLNETVASLKHGHIISESISLGIGNSAKSPTTPDWFAIFDKNMNLVAEEAKSVEKKPTKAVVDLETAGYDYKDEDNVNNMNFEEYLRGYYTEMKNPKNADKTEQELKDIVQKNLEKNALFYVEDAQFGIEGIGYKEDLPGLGKGKMVKDAGKGGGYGEATKKDFPKGDVGTGYVELKENKMISLVDLMESLPLGEKPTPKRKKPVKKATTDSKLAEIENNGKVATLELQIEAIEEIISGKNERISMVTEDDSLSELVDKKKMKEMQREVKVLEKRKSQMEKVYEKMCGKAYKKVVTELDPEAWKRQNGQDADWDPKMEEGSNGNSNLNSNDNSNENSNDNAESYSGQTRFKSK